MLLWANETPIKKENMFKDFWNEFKNSWTLDAITGFIAGVLLLCGLFLCCLEPTYVYKFKNETQSLNEIWFE